MTIIPPWMPSDPSARERVEALGEDETTWLADQWELADGPEWVPFMTTETIGGGGAGVIIAAVMLVSLVVVLLWTVATL